MALYAPTTITLPRSLTITQAGLAEVISAADGNPVTVKKHDFSNNTSGNPLHPAAQFSSELSDHEAILSTLSENH
jgi:hypothetical protein